MERTVTVTEAARDFSDLINRTYYRGESALLLRSGKPVARVVPVAPTAVTGTELAARWEHMAHLTPAEAAAMGRDIADSRAKLNVPPRSPWD